MAIIRRKELHELSEGDLMKRLGEARLEFSKDRAQITVGGSAQNPGKVKELRKTIARMLTEIKQRQLKMKKGGNKTG